MLRNIAGMKRLRVGTVIGIFSSDDPEQLPLQVAIKSDDDKWAFGGLPKPWSSEDLFNMAHRDGVTIQLMRRI